MIKKEKVLIVANWKANPDSLRLAKSIITGIKKICLKSKGVEIVICPPIIYLESLRSMVKPISLGSQDFFSEPNGAFTGSVGYEALLDTKIHFSIIGHSERREVGESNEDINKKLKTSLSVGVTPILCVGEKERGNDMGYLSILKQQLITAFIDIPKAKVKNVVIAYEPVWAIGKDAKRDASPSEVAEVVIFIKRVIGDIYKTSSVPPIRIIYGGSVNPANAGLMLSEAGINGFLVGRASLTPKIFNEIVNVANSKKND